MKKIKNFSFQKDLLIKTGEEFMLEDKINEIIDYINQSQKQPEERENRIEEKLDILFDLIKGTLPKYKYSTGNVTDFEVKTDEQIIHEQSEDCSWQNEYKSQKQPEGVEYEKRIKVLGELLGSKPEKQEGWRGELRKKLDKILWHSGDDYVCSYIGNTESLTDRIEEVISQLLSERTFTKEELEVIRESLLETYYFHQKPVLHKIDKLLDDK